MRFRQLMKALLPVLVLLVCTVAQARPPFKTDGSAGTRDLSDIGDPPFPTIAVHNVGRMALTVSNFGIIGLGGPGVDTDPATNELAPSWQYPRGYANNYLYEAQLWVGAVVGRDTLVSASNQGGWWATQEFWPREYPEGDISFRTINDPYDSLYDSAISQQDFVAFYADTIDDPDIAGYDYYSGRIHRPLNIEVRQSSYAWGYDYAEDFIIIDFQIANIELRTLRDVYIGFYVDNDIGKTNSSYYSGDDICGYLKNLPSRYIAGLADTLDLFWAADNDGDPDPISGSYAGYAAPTSAVATKVLRTPADNINYTYNWWASNWDGDRDWGPRRVEPGGIRRFARGNLGTPLTDEEKYYVMSNHEFDYNQLVAYFDRTSEGWLPPSQYAYNIAGGAEIKYLLSFGPFDIEPGEALPLTIALISGQDFYANGSPGQPNSFRDFVDLQLNGLWAGWIFDNPGIDTDGDGYRGKYHIFCMNPKITRIDTFIVSPGDTLIDTTIECTFSDTMYYAGDGVPDFRGAEPPTPPEFKLSPRINEYYQGEITIRWNGYVSETTPDQFSQRIDFEGYRIYTSRSGQSSDFTMVTSYDVENYDRWEYDSQLQSWIVKNQPYDMRLLRNMYGGDFDPTPYYNTDNLFAFYNTRVGQWETYFFTRHDWNQSDLRDTNLIHKVYPDQPYPSTLNLDTARMFYPDEVTPEGNLKYFEYEYTLKNLIPSIPYYVAVSAFDAGFPGADLRPLESKPGAVAVRAFAQNSSQKVLDEGLDVIVYPNPYRIDGNYQQYFEGWEDPLKIRERQRVLHFTNLPPKCRIRIYSIDGDLIDIVDHECEIEDPDCTHETWDLISRNDMAITSGIYYFVVESDYGNQIGKFVVIY